MRMYMLWVLFTYTLEYNTLLILIFISHICRDFLPYHWELIIASGVAEIVLGLGTFFKKYRNYSLMGNNINISNISLCSYKYVDS